MSTELVMQGARPCSPLHCISQLFTRSGSRLATPPRTAVRSVKRVMDIAMPKAWLHNREYNIHKVSKGAEKVTSLLGCMTPSHQKGRMQVPKHGKALGDQHAWVRVGRSRSHQKARRHNKRPCECRGIPLHCWHLLARPGTHHCCRHPALQPCSPRVSADFCLESRPVLHVVRVEVLGSLEDAGMSNGGRRRLQHSGAASDLQAIKNLYKCHTDVLVCCRKRQVTICKCSRKLAESASNL